MAILRWRPAGAAAERWDPFREMGEIQSEMSRLFDGFFGRSAASPGFDRVWTPAADMYETKDELVIKADLPGMSEKDVQVTITGDLLSLKGQRAEPEAMQPEQYFGAERWTGRTERIFQLPIPVQADKVRAAYRDGVLTVTLPKMESVKPKEIKIDVQ
jgi:HSP20 family protein